MFQSYNLFRNKTALQNVTEGLIVARKVPRAHAEETGMRMLEKVGMADRRDAYPSQLSRWTAAARRHRPRAGDRSGNHLLDEPTSALDPS